MYCENCGAKISGDARFCEECGAVIGNTQNETRCFKCGAVNEQGSVFCRNCGERLGYSGIPMTQNKKSNNKGKIILVILVFVLMLIGGIIAVFMIKSNKEENAERNQTIEELYEAEKNDQEFEDDSDDYIVEQEEMESEEFNNNYANEDNTSEDDGWDDNAQQTEESDYILEGSDYRYISKSELYMLSKNECRLARNEIYARHGRMFDDEELRAYFNSKDWYYPYVDGDDFSESVLNAYEKANLELIVEYEKEQGYR